MSRTFNVHVPAHHAAGTPLPIVFDLHGAFSTGLHHDLVDSRMRGKGDAAGFIVVQPDSWPHWITSPEDEAERGVSDVEFIVTLLDIMDRELCVDRDRIFVTGFSSGGLMSTQLGCASATNRLGRHKIAAIAPVAAAPIPAGPGLDAPICPARSAGPVPMRVIFSNNDKTIADRGFGGDVQVLNGAVRDVVGTWSRENGCANGSTSVQTNRTGWGVLTETVIHQCAGVADGRGDTLLDFFDTGSAQRNGHVWPGGLFGGEHQTTDVVWDFFRTHPRVAREATPSR